MFVRIYRGKALSALALLVMIVSIPSCSRRTPEREQSRVNVSPLPPVKALRKIYSYSLIPGGVETAAAFEAYRVSDKVLLNHFRDMGAKVFPTTLARDKWMFASYRISDAVYWTKNRILVHAGERLLTDGNTLLRARCGNRLSDAPAKPVQTLQPPDIGTDTFTTEVTMVAPPELFPEMDVPPLAGFPDVTPAAPPAPLEGPYTPVPPIDNGGEVLPVPVPIPPTTVGQVFYPPPLIPVSGPLTGPAPPGRPYTPPKVVPTIPTPEMSTWVLMFCGLLVLSAKFARKKLSYCR